MRQDIYFMALGGGQRVGASCYYLRLGHLNIILDAGTGWEKGAVFEPDLYPLITSPFLQSSNQINQIYISHAHMDHIGFLPELMGKAPRAETYMTQITALLSQYQLYDKKYLSGAKTGGAEIKSLEVQYMLDRITKVSYLETMDFGIYKVTFLPAGHIPGAMMMLFEYGKRRILYTGDYSLESTPMASGCMIPDDGKIDTVIMCGLHARHPEYVKRKDRLFESAGYALRLVNEKKASIACRVTQLSKGIEFIKILNWQNQDNVPIYIDESVMKVVEKMEQMSVPVLDICNKVMGRQAPEEPHIYITADREALGYCRTMNADFCLHEDFLEMQEFIKRINPRQAIMVHCAEAYRKDAQTIEQALMTDGECRTQFLFAEEKEIYQL